MKRRRFLNRRKSRKRIWKQLSDVLSEMRLLEGNDPVQWNEVISPSEKDHPQYSSSLQLTRLLLGFSLLAGLLVLRKTGLGEHGTVLAAGSHGLLTASSLSNVIGQVCDPVFPTEKSLLEAGLRMTQEGTLELPAFSGLADGDSPASQVLKGTRYGRKVMSGVITSSVGKILVRTGISSKPPAFSCQIRDGHLLSYNSPVEVNSMMLSGRIGPGSVTIINDGRWLVMDRAINRYPEEDSCWLLLRQLRDISALEMLLASEDHGYLADCGEAVSEDRVYEGSYN